MTIGLGWIVAAIVAGLGTIAAAYQRRQGRKAEREDRVKEKERADARTNESIDAGVARAGDGDWRSRLRRHRGE